MFHLHLMRSLLLLCRVSKSKVNQKNKHKTMTKIRKQGFKNVVCFFKMTGNTNLPFANEEFRVNYFTYSDNQTSKYYNCNLSTCQSSFNCLPVVFLWIFGSCKMTKTQTELYIFLYVFFKLLTNIKQFLSTNSLLL